MRAMPVMRSASVVKSGVKAACKVPRELVSRGCSYRIKISVPPSCKVLH
jgi:hypothetical protein